MEGVLDPRIWQALIAGGVVALGWLVNGWRVRQDAGRLRAERTRDAHKALFAEIREVCAAYWLDGAAEARADALMERMAREPGFVPFVARERRGRIYEAMLGEVDLLPRQTIDTVVAFYATVGAVEALAEDMRGDRYPTLAPERRLAIYRDWIAMRARALSYGQAALRIIDAYATGGAAAAERLAPPSGARAVPGGRGGGRRGAA